MFGSLVTSKPTRLRRATRVCTAVLGMRCFLSLSCLVLENTQLNCAWPSISWDVHSASEFCRQDAVSDQRSLWTIVGWPVWSFEPLGRSPRWNILFIHMVIIGEVLEVCIRNNRLGGNCLYHCYPLCIIPTIKKTTFHCRTIKSTEWFLARYSFKFLVGSHHHLATSTPILTSVSQYQTQTVIDTADLSYIGTSTVLVAPNRPCGTWVVCVNMYAR